MLSVASGKSGISPGNLSAWSTFVSVTSLSFLLLLHLPEFFLVLVSRSPQARALPVAQRPPGPGLSQEGEEGHSVAATFIHTVGALSLQLGGLLSGITFSPSNLK